MADDSDPTDILRQAYGPDSRSTADVMSQYREPVGERGFLWPWMRQGDQLSPAVPGILHDPYEAIKRLLSREYGYRPGSGEEGPIQDATNVAGAVAMPNVMARRAAIARAQRPVTAYHGTLGDFERLDPRAAHAPHSNSEDPFAAVHLTDSLDAAKLHANADNPYSTGSRIIEAQIDPTRMKTMDYAKLLRQQWRDEGNVGPFDPHTADAWIIPPSAVEAAQRQGYGGLTLRNGPQGSTEHAIWDIAALLSQRDLPRPW